MDPNGGRPPYPPQSQSYSHPHPQLHPSQLQQPPQFNHQSASYNGAASPSAHPNQLNPPLGPPHIQQNAGGRLSPAVNRGMAPQGMDQMNQGMQGMSLQPPTPVSEAFPLRHSSIRKLNYANNHRGSIRVLQLQEVDR